MRHLARFALLLAPLPIFACSTRGTLSHPASKPKAPVARKVASAGKFTLACDDLKSLPEHAPIILQDYRGDKPGAPGYYHAAVGGLNQLSLSAAFAGQAWPDDARLRCGIMKSACDPRETTLYGCGSGNLNFQICFSPERLSKKRGAGDRIALQVGFQDSPGGHPEKGSASCFVIPIDSPTLLCGKSTPKDLDDWANSSIVLSDYRSGFHYAGTRSSSSRKLSSEAKPHDQLTLSVPGATPYRELLMPDPVPMANGVQFKAEATREDGASAELTCTTLL